MPIPSVAPVQVFVNPFDGLMDMKGEKRAPRGFRMQLPNGNWLSVVENSNSHLIFDEFSVMVMDAKGDTLEVQSAVHARQLMELIHKYSGGEG